ncbi:MBL fold metallo-hydrolase [Alienimonas californiensis]|uniref:Beta-lactamase hydrolase-like protein n=1 Tax=Alienimonas californiensis TaxID=2527989 RepID=A0A517PBB1_9PLAN|nr:MBL fold metallo-hydrolase [Alienimonas californiensis]QDT16674.1 Beta-lactamase hydrolase-like protein [Alienimonas californiensis]
MSLVTRRELLGHAGALGLGVAFLPHAARVVRAGETGRPARGETPDGVVLEVVESGGLSHYSYFLADTRAGVAAVIDPRRDVAAYLKLAEEHGVTITLAIETHVHADFVSGARELADRTGTAKIAASVEGGAAYGFPVDRKLKDGDTLNVGSIRLRAIHTPGHTPEHLSYVASTKKEDRPWSLFTGDFLFIGSIGRPDLMGVKNTEGLAQKLYQSVRTAYADLPDALPIHPAHGPGSPCGANIQKPKGTPTLGRERDANPYWRIEDQADFVEALLAAQPPIPYYWPRMKQVNAAGPKVLGDRPAPEALAPAAFEKLIAGGDVQLVDTQLMFGYAGGHIRGATDLGYNEVMSLWGGWTLDYDKPIALVVPETADAEGPRDWLARVDLTEVQGFLKGGMTAWVKSGRPFDSFQTMSVREVHETFPTDAMQLLDVRQPSEWDMGHVKGAKYIFLPELPKRLNELDRSKPVVVYCGNGYRATLGASLLRQNGFDARTVPGSWDAWTAAGLPVQTPRSPGKPSDTTRRSA